MLNEKPVVNDEDSLFEQAEIDAEIGAVLEADAAEDQEKVELKLDGIFENTEDDSSNNQIESETTKTTETTETTETI